MKKNNQIVVSGAVVFKEYRRKKLFLVVKQSQEGKWEIPKVTVRRGESSVRASLRMIAEMAGMNARVLEEAGRSTAVATINGKSLPQKTYYYLLIHKAGGEILGFQDFEWLEYAKAIKKLELKREKDMLKGAKNVLKKWEKEGRKR
ncbi:NUDIX domain-containing protein [Candidatus Woesebacteria bacterium]|nr:NUDIX domain-containing protein [Candidatus Woesebacteria bacterium]